MEAVKIQSLTKKYKDTVAVDGLNLTVNKGELLALLGVNGAGKSTTVKMLSCLTRPTDGDAFVMGKSILKEPDEVKKLIAVSPQETAVASGLTVKENLLLMCGAHGFSRAKSQNKTEELLKKMSLTEISNKKAGKLSGGWQRRLSIAMALISEPEVLFLDEPTLGLDVLGRCELWDIITDLKKMTTIILTTHYMEEAEKLSDRIAIMKEGSLLICATASEIKIKAGTDDFEEAFIRMVKEAKKC